MQRINTSTKAGDLHGPGKDGFRPGDPNAGILPTQLSADWCNAVQESLCRVIEAGGRTVGNAGNDDLFLALGDIISSAVQAAANPSGKVAMFARSTAPSGWVRLNGGTIGNAGSGASERANADAHDLYVLLWNEFDNTLCPVVGGRGASAENDWAANKKLTLPDDRGYFWRAWDGGRGIDAERGLGTYQADGNKAHTHGATTGGAGGHNHSVYVGSSDGDGSSNGAGAGWGIALDFANPSIPSNGTLLNTAALSLVGDHSHSITIGSSGNGEVTVKSRAYLPCIKL